MINEMTFILSSTAEILGVFVAIITLLVGSLIAALWKFVLGRIKTNECDISDLQRKHDEDIEFLDKKRDEDYERIKEFIERSTKMGDDESELLIRIDERVSDIRNDLNKVKDQVDELYKTNGGKKDGSE